MAQRHVQVVVNPAAGREEPILATLNRVFRDTDIQWDVSLTKVSGDAFRLTRQACADGADIVLVYGGDGTVKEAASALSGQGVPLAILPGGTANVMAAELHIPSDLAKAAALLLEGAHSLRTIDLGRVPEHDENFLLRLGIGWEARWMMNADVGEKANFGRFAYFLSALRTPLDDTRALYRVTVDGETYESEGITCAVTNSGNLGLPGLSAHAKCDVGDGLLDVLVIHELAIDDLLSPNLPERLISLWQGKDVTVEAEPSQPIIADGEPIGEGPIRAQIVPGALQVVVPAESVE